MLCIFFFRFFSAPSLLHRTHDTFRCSWRCCPLHPLYTQLLPYYTLPTPPLHPTYSPLYTPATPYLQPVYTLPTPPLHPPSTPPRQMTRGHNWEAGNDSFVPSGLTSFVCSLRPHYLLLKEEDGKKGREERVEGREKMKNREG